MASFHNLSLFISILYQLILSAMGESYHDLFSNKDRPEALDEYSIQFTIPNLPVDKTHNSYCSVKSFLHIRDRENIVSIHQTVEPSTHVIRMMLIGCSKPHKKTGYWDCMESENLCQDDPQIVYSWGPDAPDVTLPPGVGYQIGASTLIKYLILEVDYDPLPISLKDNSGFVLGISRDEMHFKAGTYVFVGTAGSAEDLDIDVACTFNHEHAVFPFGFAMLANEDVSLITSYKVGNVNGQVVWDVIGKGSPRWPQVFYPMEHVPEIVNGDILALRCVRDVTSASYLDQSGGDSQCSFTLIFFTLVENPNTFMLCTQPGHRDLFSTIPPGFDQFDGYPNNILLEDSYSVDVIKYETIINHQKQQLQKMGHVDQDAGLSKGDASDDDGGGGNPNKVVSHVESNEENEHKVGPVVLDETWPGPAFDPSQYGEITGVGQLSNGSVVFVHRAGRTHDHASFDQDHFYQPSKVAIPTDTLILLDSDTGRVLGGFGRGMFVLPRGLFVDHKDNMWVTDIAKHQVYLLSLINVDQPVTKLGETFTPGSDATHLCSPTDVAVDDKTGEIYVADGFCNSRIVKFSPNYKYVTEYQFKDKDNTGISILHEIHSVTLAGALGLVCGADGTHGQVVCFNKGSGAMERVFHSASFGPRLASIAYSHPGSLFYVLNAPSSPNVKVQAFSVDIRAAESTILQTFSPSDSGFTDPYDICVSSSNQYIFVAEAHGDRKLSKFIQTEPSFIARGASVPKAANLIGRNAEGFDEEKSNFYSSLAILMLIAIPLTIVVTATVVSRMRARARMDLRAYSSWVNKKGYEKEKKKKRQGKQGQNGISMFSNKKGGGFQRLPSEDSDREADRLTDSEVEEFTSNTIM